MEGGGWWEPQGGPCDEVAGWCVFPFSSKLWHSFKSEGLSNGVSTPEASKSLFPTCLERGDRPLTHVSPVISVLTSLG